MKQHSFYLLVTLFSFSTVCAAQSSINDMQRAWDSWNKGVEKMSDEMSDESKRRANSFTTRELEDMSWMSEDDMYKTINDSRPVVDSPTTVYMGDTMMVQRIGFVADCVIPAKTVSNSVTGWTYTIRAGIPACKGSKSDKAYTTPYTNGINDKWDGSKEDLMPLYVEKNKNGDTYNVCLKRMGMRAVCLNDATEADVKVGPAFVTSPSALQRSIEYAGKSGSIVKFVYSESIGGLARDSFTREFEVDLNEGTVAAYKGLVFEIVEANNAEITYVIKRHFPM